MAKKYKFTPRRYQAALDALDGQDRVVLDYGATLTMRSDGSIVWGYDAICFKYDKGGMLTDLPCGLVIYQPSGFIEARINRDANKDVNQLTNHTLSRCHTPISLYHNATPAAVKWAAHKSACTVDEWEAFVLLFARCIQDNGGMAILTGSQVFAEAFAHFVSGVDLTALEIACKSALRAGIA